MSIMRHGWTAICSLLVAVTTASATPVAAAEHDDERVLDATVVAGQSAADGN
jgi:hypothetical protein